jgi:hypothetical protein
MRTLTLATLGTTRCRLKALAFLFSIHISPSMMFENTTARNVFRHPSKIKAASYFSGTCVRYHINNITFRCILDYLRHRASIVNAEIYPEEGSSIFFRKAYFHVPHPQHAAITQKNTT